ncbi:DddA-like double-stranded DNA deaminase toxin [Micromonospora sp. WMMD1274]|uniref:DddA-like double-stranded DNA deaminase toxin n=1 Tax=Micromonospora sp. WMMD1274 TaxID=3404116 RepID=UPI003B945E6D
MRVDPAALPDTLRRAIGRFEPRPAGSTRPTAGLLNDEAVTSGGGDRSLAADLVHDPLRGPPVTFYDHVESKAAAHLRRTAAAEADLAIDNTVCGTNDRDRSYSWTCDRILPAILPSGSRLRLWVTRDGGHTWWHRTYTGTGERIRR